jgi:hypothetical protein
MEGTTAEPMSRSGKQGRHGGRGADGAAAAAALERLPESKQREGAREMVARVSGGGREERRGALIHRREDRMGDA